MKGRGECKVEERGKGEGKRGECKGEVRVGRRGDRVRGKYREERENEREKIE